MHEEFNYIYVLNFKGNGRLVGEFNKKSGGMIFEKSSRLPISIIFLIKQKNNKSPHKIYYYEVEDYLTSKEKLDKIEEIKSIESLDKGNKLTEIKPDRYNDWLNQRDLNYYDLIQLGNKKDKSELIIFNDYSNGMKTGRDAWMYNYSKSNLTYNLKNTINFYNSELDRYQNSKEKSKEPKDLKKFESYISNFLNNNREKISWSRDLKYDIYRNRKKTYNPDSIRIGDFRPFSKRFLYCNAELAGRTGQIYKFFPEEDIKNLVIGVNGIGAMEFGCLMFSATPNGNCFDSNRYFPLRIFNKMTTEERLNAEDRTFIVSKSGQSYHVKDGISNQALNVFQDKYKDADINKEDIFFYIYAFLFNKSFKAKYKTNLIKDNTRIALVDNLKIFKKYVILGKELSCLHADYESVPPYKPRYKNNIDIEKLENKDLYLKRIKIKKDTIIFNNEITLLDIPKEAFSFMIGSRNAVEWVADQYRVKKDIKSKITNDSNYFGIEAYNNPRYILDLLLKVINLSIKTNKIIKKINSE